MNTTRRGLYKRWIYLVSLCVTGVVSILLIWFAFTFLRTLRLNGITPQFLYQVVSKNYIALKQSKNRVTLLLLGMSGGDKDGSDLADTIEVITVDTQKDTISIIDVPRDIWSVTVHDKIDSAYLYGEEKKKGGGLILSRVILEDILGIPIQYVLKVDFKDFTKIIDLFGGITVDVKQGFTDSEYPIDSKDTTRCPQSQRPSCLYKTVTFVKGIEHMNGERALIYSRSRHVLSDEGSVLARVRRQQEILHALLERFTRPTLWFRFEKIQLFKQNLEDAIQKDISIGELISFAAIVARASKNDINTIDIGSLFEIPNHSLFADRYELLPIVSWDAVHAYIARSLK